MTWSNTANEIHKRHCDTQLQLAESKKQETIAKAAKESFEAVADVAKEMAKSGDSKEARMLINDAIKGMGETSKKLNAAN